MTARFLCFLIYVRDLVEQTCFQCLFLGGLFLHPGGVPTLQVPPAMVELQHNSERWRQRATNVGMEPEDE